MFPCPFIEPLISVLFCNFCSTRFSFVLVKLIPKYFILLKRHLFPFLLLCVYAHMCTHAHHMSECLKKCQKKASQEIVSHPMWVLGTKLGPSGRVESTVSLIVEPSLQPLFHSFCCRGWKSRLTSLSIPFPSTPPPFPSYLLIHFLWDWNSCAVYTGWRFPMCLWMTTLIFGFSGLHLASATIPGVCCPTQAMQGWGLGLCPC